METCKQDKNLQLCDERTRTKRGTKRQMHMDSEESSIETIAPQSKLRDNNHMHMLLHKKTRSTKKKNLELQSMQGIRSG